MRRLLLVALLVGLVVSLLPGVASAAAPDAASALAAGANITNRFGTYTISNNDGVPFYTYWTQQKSRLGDVRSNRWRASNGRWRQRYSYAITEWAPASGSAPGYMCLVPPWGAEEATFNYINSIRRSHGLRAFIHDPVLYRAARWKSNDMAVNNYFSHDSPTLPGATFNKIVQLGKAWGRDFCWWGENLGKVYLGTGSQSGGARGIIDAMMAERAPNDGHRKAILSGQAKRTGLGLVVSKSHYLYLSQEFSD
jgi:hypothetical protein